MCMCILDWVCRKRKRGAEKSKPIRKPLKFQNLRLTLSFFAVLDFGVY